MTVVNKPHKFAIVAASVVATLALGSVALATTSQQTACASKKSGAMRLLTKGHCTSHERTVSLGGARTGNTIVDSVGTSVAAQIVGTGQQGATVLIDGVLWQLRANRTGSDWVTYSDLHASYTDAQCTNAVVWGEDDGESIGFANASYRLVGGRPGDFPSSPVTESGGRSQFTDVPMWDSVDLGFTWACNPFADTVASGIYVHVVSTPQPPALVGPVSIK